MLTSESFSGEDALIARHSRNSKLFKPHVSPQNAIGQNRIHHTQRNVCVWGGWTGDSR